MEYLNKRQPLPSMWSAWTTQDELAAKSTFDFRASDMSFFSQPVTFLPIAPKDSLSRTTFWVSVDTPGRIKFKCNLAEKTEKNNIDTLKAAIKKLDYLERNRVITLSDTSSEKQSKSPRKASPVVIHKIKKDTLHERIPEKVPIKEIRIARTNEREPVRERVLKKAAGKFSKTGRTSQIYKFIDWEKKADEKYNKPTGVSDLNRFRKKRLMPSLMEPLIQEKIKAKEKVNWITLTDMNLSQGENHAQSVARKLSPEKKEQTIDNKDVKEKPTLIATKIFQRHNNENREKSQEPKTSLVIPHLLLETRTRIGLISDEIQIAKAKMMVKPFELALEPRNAIPDLSIYGITVDNKLLDEFEHQKSLYFYKQKLPLNSSDRFDYNVSTPPFELDEKGHLKVNYIADLSKIYERSPVKALCYFYHGSLILSHEKIILQLINRYEYTSNEEKEKEISFIHKQYTVAQLEEKNNSELSIITSRPRFKYTLIKVGLDDKLTREDLESLSPQEYKMMVAFFNVKFSILDKPDKLNLDDPIEHVIKVANAHIQGVLARANNFKKNEEFLKKKWKEFLKFCRFKVKEQYNLKRKP